MSSKSSRKVKKPLDLPLGKAITTKDVDLSHVRLPIDTSVFGLKHVFTLFETATNEVKSYLAYECDLMYECRVCRTIFRSIANFILHKRKFCRDKYNTPKDPSQSCQQKDGVTLIQKDIEKANLIIAETEEPGKTKTPGCSLNPIIENLLKRQEQKKFVQDLKNENTVNIPKHEELKKVGDLECISLEKIDGSDVAMFQTMEFGPNLGTELMKTQVMEIHSIFDNDEALIGSNGEILSSGSKEKGHKQISRNDYICTECNTKFSTKKTLTYHVKYKHSESKLVYPCPLCKDSLSNAWSVYRHLLKIHRMTSNQIRKYRNQIHNSAIYKKTEDPKDRRKNVRESRQENDEENEWLDNIEGDGDLQMCGGCGKHFDRRAALISHSVMCTKRIAVCNSIKENNSKKKGMDMKENDDKFLSTSLCKMTGSAKRKSGNLINYKPKTENSPNNIQTQETVIEATAEDSEITAVNLSSIVGSEIKTIDLSLIVEENDSDTENCTERINKDIQMYDKDRVMSIIGVERGASTDQVITLSSDISNKNSSSEDSSRSESPCKGFATIESSVNIVSIENLYNFKKPCEEDVTYIPDTSLSLKQVSSNSGQKVTEYAKDKVTVASISDVQSEGAEAQSNTSDNPENKRIEEVVSISSDDSECKSSSESEVEITSDISLDDKINSDFKLDLGDDPYYQDVSIKSLIKEIIQEKDIDSETKESVKMQRAEICTTSKENAICNGLDEKKTTNEVLHTVKHFTNEERLNNNYDVEIIENVISEVKGESSVKLKKRKRINSLERTVKKKSISNTSEDTLDVTKNEVFISKISPLTDMTNLLCHLCESQFNLMSELLLHMSKHISWYRFQCSSCSFMSFNKCDCEKHAQEDHKVQAEVFTIPAWKSALISDNYMLLQSPLKDREDEMSLESDSKTVGEVEMLVDLTANSVKQETTEEYCSNNERKVIDYVDLTDEQNPDDYTNCLETTENCLLETGTRRFQDLSKQAILEVILGNKNQKENHMNECLSSRSCETARPMRNRTKSVKASQKDFIYDFGGVKDTLIGGHSSKVDTEHIPACEVQD